jgi:hypothetical protein
VEKKKDKGSLNPTAPVVFSKLLARVSSNKEQKNAVQQAAENYAKSKGIKLSQLEKVKVNPEVSKKIAQAFDSLPDNPDDPAVKKAYEALIQETLDQYQEIKKTGLKVIPMKPDQPNPYTNSQAVVDDILKNNRLQYYPTDQGYGSGSAARNPLLRETAEIADGKPMLANDVFRVVHDYFGHAKDGNKFGATGEENAYRAHKQMYSPEAQKALTTETRGQNSWVNYGPKGEVNRANPAATTYAEQKAGLLPDWAMKDVDELANPLAYRLKQVGRVAKKAVLPAAVLGAGLLSDSAGDAIMDTIVPGGVESAGANSDVVPEDDTFQVRSMAETDPDQNLRRAALKELRDRSRNR